MDLEVTKALKGAFLLDRLRFFVKRLRFQKANRKRKTALQIPASAKTFPVYGFYTFLYKKYYIEIKNIVFYFRL